MLKVGDKVEINTSALIGCKGYILDISEEGRCKLTIVSDSNSTEEEFGQPFTTFVDIKDIFKVD